MDERRTELSRAELIATAGMTDTGVDRELLAVLVALEPLDDRKWGYVNLTDRTFHADRMLDEHSWSSGERVLIDVAASLWNTGSVDLGYIACALSDRPLQAVIDATALRVGHNLTSNVDRAIARIAAAARIRAGNDLSTEQRAFRPLDPVIRPDARLRHGLGR